MASEMPSDGERAAPLAEDDLRVLVVADDHLARAGLAAMLTDQSGCTVVGQMAASEYASLEPGVFSADLVLWDLGWDPAAALDVLAETTESATPAVVLVPDESYANEAWATGARGLLQREVDVATLMGALTAVSQGLAVLDPELSPAFSVPQAAERPPLTQAVLTPRELEVLGLIADGLPNKTIAGRLDISEHTVKFHVNAILGKLGAQSRTEAVTLATRMGLITL